MEKKINVAQLLKNCPKGMELYSPIFGTVYFEGIRDTGRAILIDVTTSCNTSVQFYSDGKFNTYYSDSEVTLFPSKENRDWSTFQGFNKFDITTLRPFESRVLVRDSDSEKWYPAIWGFYNEDGCDYHYEVVGGNSFSYCIPYEGNEHLRGSTDDCDDYYKNWE